MARILGIDYGEKRVGIAVSDENNILAMPILTITGDKRTLLEHIRELVRKYNISVIVMGLPRLLSGENSDISRKARKFGKELEKLGVEIVFVDEWFTTRAAERTIRELGKKPSRQKELIDKVSAALILQTFLEKMRVKTENDKTEH